MNNEEMRKTIEFILEQQASTSVKQEKNTEDIAGLTKDVKELTKNVDNLATEMRLGFAETREVLDSLITSMLNIKHLTEQVAELNLHTSKRVTAVEKKVKELAKKSK